MEKKRGGGASSAPAAAAAGSDVASELPDEQRRFLHECTVAVPKITPGRYPCAADKAAEAAAVERALGALEKHHMVVLDNALGAEDLAAVTAEFHEMLDFGSDVRGGSAFGEKVSRNRSATRMYNCKCQVGPECGWSGWREGSAGTRDRLHGTERPRVWERVCAHHGFVHCRRVEVVTSHPGCRCQGWHVDAERGLTAIFALVDVDVRKGPTQLDFTVPFNALEDEAPKVKHCAPPSPPTAFAPLTAGSVVIFNANCSHRGTANISDGDRPVLVVDCSPPCASEPQSQWDL
jgi:hypothetical protein